MMFDLLASVVERHLPRHTQTMARAKIFRLEPRHSFASAGEAIDAWEPDERTIENFRLPFKVVAIEYAPERRASSDSCVVLSFRDETTRSMDFIVACCTNRDNVTIAAGVCHALPNAEQSCDLSKWDKILQVQEMAIWDGNKRGVSPVESRLDWIDHDLERIDCLEKGNSVERALAKHASGVPLAEAIGTLDCSLPEVQRQVAKLQNHVAHGRLVVGVLSVLIINEPACFVVEERPLSTPRGTSLPIRRSHDRPHFIVLKPRQIRERFFWQDEAENDDEEKRHVGAHERRGHFRRLQSNRFVKAKGHTIWIKPMWVGPEESVKNGNRYKVRLDL